MLYSPLCSVKMLPPILCLGGLSPLILDPCLSPILPAMGGWPPGSGGPEGSAPPPPGLPPAASFPCCAPITLTLAHCSLKWNSWETRKKSLIISEKSMSRYHAQCMMSVFDCEWILAASIWCIFNWPLNYHQNSSSSPRRPVLTNDWWVTHSYHCWPYYYHNITYVDVDDVFSDSLMYNFHMFYVWDHHLKEMESG